MHIKKKKKKMNKNKVSKMNKKNQYLALNAHLLLVKSRLKGSNRISRSRRKLIKNTISKI